MHERRRTALWLLLSLSTRCAPPASAGDASSEAAGPADGAQPADATSADAAPTSDALEPDAAASDSATSDAGLVSAGEILVSGVAPWDIALGGGFIYIAEANNVQRVSVTGGMPSLVYTTGSTTMVTQSVDADATRVAWTERDRGSTVRGAVRACPHTGCSATATTNLNFGESTDRIALDGSAVFWTSRSLHAALGTTGPTGWRSPSIGSMLERSYPSDIAIEGGDVLWSTIGLSSAMRPGVVLSCPTTARMCSPSVLSSAVGPAYRIAATSAYIYTLGSLGLFRSRRDGTAPQRLADGNGGLAEFIDLAADERAVYWGIGPRLYRCDPSACSPTLVAELTGQGVQGLELDADYVYFGAADIAHRAGSVRRVRR